jgi:hypothetical protein
MGFFDERILTSLKNGKPKDFTTLLSEVGFTTTLYSNTSPG